MKVLFVTARAEPLTGRGRLDEYASALPAALRRLDVDARLLLPGYPAVLDAGTLEPVVEGLPVLAGREKMRLLTGAPGDARTPLYVLDSPALYRRDGGPCQNPQHRDWPDNALRFGALGRVAALLGSRASPLPWRPDVVHCCGWQGALGTVFLAGAGSVRARSVMRVDDLAEQGLFAAHTASELGLTAQRFDRDGLEFNHQLSFLKSGLYYADRIVAPGPTRAAEIQSEDHGGGLHALFASRKDRLNGILDGIDTARWDPAADPFLACRYHRDDLDGKRENKRALQQTMGLEQNPDVPLVGMVTSLDADQGVDLMLEDCSRLVVRQRLQLAVLGRGRQDLEAQLGMIARDHLGQVGVVFGDDQNLAHQILAGADMLLARPGSPWGPGRRWRPCAMARRRSCAAPAPWPTR